MNSQPNRDMLAKVDRELIELSYMMPVVLELNRANLIANTRLAHKLWSRFSADQCASWISFEGPDQNQVIERFILWLNSGMDQNEAFS